MYTGIMYLHCYCGSVYVSRLLPILVPSKTIPTYWTRIPLPKCDVFTPESHNEVRCVGYRFLVGTFGKLRALCASNVFTPQHIS